MPIFEIEIDEAQVAALTMYADSIGLTAAECIKMGVLWTIHIEVMRATDSTPTLEDWSDRFERVEAQLDQIVARIIAERVG